MIALILTGLGTLIVLAAALATLRGREPVDRVHYLSVVTSLGGPVVGAGLVVANGWSLTTGTVLLIVALLGATTPVLSAAVGNMATNRGADR
jgi:multisubunit Na+/H+ antiporter MnhG subunit